jgi:hypothetical protein
MNTSRSFNKPGHYWRLAPLRPPARRESGRHRESCDGTDTQEAPQNDRRAGRKAIGEAQRERWAAIKATKKTK